MNNAFLKVLSSGFFLILEFVIPELYNPELFKNCLLRKLFPPEGTYQMLYILFQKIDDWSE